MLMQMLIDKEPPNKTWKLFKEKIINSPEWNWYFFINWACVQMNECQMKCKITNTNASLLFETKYFTHFAIN